MASKRQTPSPTTTAPAGGTNTPSADAYANANQLPAGGSTTTGGSNGPGYLGVGYQTNDSGQALVVYEDGTVGTLDPQGKPQAKNGPTGTPQKYVIIQPGQTITDANGVPQPYSAPVDTSALGGTPYVPIPAVSYVPAKYRAGDEVRELGSMSPEMRAQVIQVMRDKGLISDNATPNDWWSAMRQVMSQANSTGQDWQTELQQMPTVSTAKPQPRNIYNITLHNPDDLRAIFKKASGDLVGGPVPDSEVEKFVSAYQSQEKLDQQKAINAAEMADRTNKQIAAGLGSPQLVTSGDREVDITQPNVQDASNQPIVNTQTQTVDPTTFAQNMIRSDMGGEVNKYALLGTYNTFMNLIANGIR